MLHVLQKMATSTSTERGNCWTKCLEGPFLELHYWRKFDWESTELIVPMLWDMSHIALHRFSSLQVCLSYVHTHPLISGLLLLRLSGAAAPRLSCFISEAGATAPGLWWLWLFCGGFINWRLSLMQGFTIRRVRGRWEIKPWWSTVGTEDTLRWYKNVIKQCWTILINMFSSVNVSKSSQITHNTIK